MRLFAVLVVVALALIYGSVRLVQPRASRHGAAAGPADISHPPTTFGASTIVTAPHVPPEGEKADR